MSELDSPYWRVIIYYSMDHFPNHDETIKAAVDRPSDFSGGGMGERDVGWHCQTELEARRIYNAIKQYGHAEMKEIHHD